MKQLDPKIVESCCLLEIPIHFKYPWKARLGDIIYIHSNGYCGVVVCITEDSSDGTQPSNWIIHKNETT